MQLTCGQCTNFVFVFLSWYKNCDLRSIHSADTIREIAVVATEISCLTVVSSLQLSIVYCGSFDLSVLCLLFVLVMYLVSELHILSFLRGCFSGHKALNENSPCLSCCFSGYKCSWSSGRVLTEEWMPPEPCHHGDNSTKISPNNSNKAPIFYAQTN